MKSLITLNSVWRGLFAAVLLVPGLAIPAGDAVPTTDDIARAAADAKRANVPLVLVFAQDHCDFCDRLDRDILNPSYSSGLFEGRAKVRRVMIDSYLNTRDFDGKPLDKDQLRSRFKVFVTPTVMVFDSKGTELVPSIIGIENAEFYSAYLDMAIDDARARLTHQ